jgi:5'-3' exonuclease
MRDLVLIDANSIGHAAHQSTVLKAGDQNTQAIFGAIKAVRNYQIRYPQSALVCLWDGLSWRKAVSKTYKANRRDDPKKVAVADDYVAQAKMIRKALRLLGISQAFARNLEADDLAAYFVRRSDQRRVRLITGDRDWLQLVTLNVTWEDHRDDSRFCDHRSFHRFTGYQSPQRFAQGKALQGDASDNLKGVGRLGDVKARELLEVWGDVRTFLASSDPGGYYQERQGRKMHKAFADFHADPERQRVFFENMRLMSLLGDLPEPEGLGFVREAPQPEAFRNLCAAYGFRSILASFDTFVAPFLPPSSERLTHGAC